MHFLDLWRWTGRVDRKTYAAVGFVGFAVKFLVDGLLKRHFLPGDTAFLFNDWAPLGIDVHLNWDTEHAVGPGFRTGDS